MSRRGNCYDNAVMESFFSTVKSELADRFASFGEAKMELFDYIEVFYNQRRRHSTLGQISPAAFERRRPWRSVTGGRLVGIPTATAQHDGHGRQAPVDFLRPLKENDRRTEADRLN